MKHISAASHANRALGRAFTKSARKDRAGIALAMAAAMAATATPAVAQTPRGPVAASIVYDADADSVLFEYNSNTRLFPASTTKLMTAYLVFQALESGRLRRDQMLTVSGNAAAQPRTNLALGSLGVRSISVDDALRGLMVHSANDAAVVLGEALGGDRAGFARMMNAQARRLGMSNSNFYNANGLGHDSQVTTARDMVRLLEAIQRDFPQYYDEYLGIRSFSYRGTTWSNTNRLLGSEQCPGVDGGKTGFIRASGTNVVLSAERGGHRVIVGVFGRSSSAVRNELACNMVNYAFYRMFSDPATGPYNVDRTYPVVMPPAPETPVTPATPADDTTIGTPYLPLPSPATPAGIGLSPLRATFSTMGGTPLGMTLMAARLLPQAIKTDDMPRYSLNFTLRA